MPLHRFATRLPVLLVLLCSAAVAQESRPSYDPLRVAEDQKIETLDLAVKDAKREREFPIRIYLPPAAADSKAVAAKKGAPLVIFSHGLGGSREGSPYLGRHWAARGYIGVFVQHPGSDESVWKDAGPRERRSVLARAANGANLILRVGDVKALLDQLALWNGDEQHALHGRLDLDHVGMTGHSFGAVTTQWLSGQSDPMGRKDFADPRIDAAIPFSPSGARKGEDLGKSFAGVKIPWLLMTGTKDVSPIGEIDVENRLSVFPALPVGKYYELVLDGAEHSVFTEGRARRRNPNHHRVILALSTAFLDAYLRGDKEALAWLDGEGPRGLLDPKDRWQTKKKAD